MRRVTGALALLLSTAAMGQDVTLTKDCEEGFRRLIHMAQTGQMGEDVTNANVGAMGDRARVELVRTGALAKQFVLTPKHSAQTIARYFDIEPGEGATASDVARLGRALDDVFSADPFHLAGLEESVGGEPMPSLREAWTYGTWRGVLRVFERRMMVLASLRYTIGLIVALALGVLASLLLLWGAVPPRSTPGSLTDSL